jgi:RNase P protein component
MAVSISRKHDKRAVQRNRYRRGLYDGLLQYLKGRTDNQEPTTKHYYQCIFTLKKGLKILEKKIPDAWIEDAAKLLQKVRQ